MKLSRKKPWGARQWIFFKENFLIYQQLQLHWSFDLYAGQPFRTCCNIYCGDFFSPPDLKISVIPSPLHICIYNMYNYICIYVYICRVVNAIMSLRCCAMFLLHVQPWWSFRKSSVLRFEDIGCADALDPSLERVMMLARWQFGEFCNSISKKKYEGCSMAGVFRILNGDMLELVIIFLKFFFSCW